MQDYQRTTWYDAQKKCRSFNGGDLVSILTSGENEYILRKVRQLNPDLSRDKDDPKIGFYYPWIGLYLKDKNSTGNDFKTLSEM